MTTEIAMNTPALAQLMGAYFHQDWYDEHQDEWATLRDFLDGEPQLLPLLPGEIDRVLSEHPTDDQVRDVLLDLGSCYTTTDAEGGYRGWLREIARRVRARLAEDN